MSRALGRLAVRLALAAGVALGIIVGLEWSLRRQDAAAAERVAAAGNAARRAAAPDIAAGASPRELGLRAARVVLCTVPRVPAAAAAVWHVPQEGPAVVLRPPPLPAAPGERMLPAVAIALPVQRLAALLPSQRAALLDLLSALLVDRPAAAGRVDLAGIAGDEGDVLALLRWLR